MIKMWDFTCEGLRVRKYMLLGERREWLGDVVLESDDAAGWGRIYSVTDYGDYCGHWASVGHKGFDRFLIDASNDYLARRLGMGHAEVSTFDRDATIESIAEDFEEFAAHEDPDWMGGMLAQLRSCQTPTEIRDWADDAGYDEALELIEYGLGGSLPGYRDRLIPALKAAIAEDMGVVLNADD